MSFQPRKQEGKPLPRSGKGPSWGEVQKDHQGRHQRPVSPGSSHLDGACYNNERRINGTLISLKANCPGAWRKFVLSLDRPKSPDEANKTATLPVPMSSLPQGRKFVLSLHRPKSPDEAHKTATLPVPTASLPQGRAVIIGKRRLLADASLGPASLPQRPQNRASVGHSSPAPDLLLTCKNGPSARRPGDGQQALGSPALLSHHLPPGFLLRCKLLEVSLSGALLGAWHILGAQYMFVG